MAAAIGRPNVTASRTIGGRVDTQLPIGLGAERVVDGGEGDAQGDEHGDGEDLGVVEAGVAQRLHVGGGGRVRIAGELAGPAGERPLGVVERRVVAAQHALGDVGAGVAGQLLAPRQRAVRVAEGRGAGGDEDGALPERE